MDTFILASIVCKICRQHVKIDDNTKQGRRIRSISHNLQKINFFVLVKKANQMCGSFILKLIKSDYLGPKDPWPRVLSLPERFVGDPASLARDIIF